MKENITYSGYLNDGIDILIVNIMICLDLPQILILIFIVFGRDGSNQGQLAPLTSSLITIVAVTRKMLVMVMMMFVVVMMMMMMMMVR